MFESERLKLEAMSEKNIKVIFDIYNNYDIQTCISCESEPVMAKEFAEFRKDCIENKYNFAVLSKETNQVIGMLKLSKKDIVNVVYPMTFLKKEYRGKGLGTELSELAAFIAFNELNAQKMRTIVYDFNLASYKRYERLGWTLEGTIRKEVFRYGRYWDVLNYGILKEEYDNKKRS